MSYVVTADQRGSRRGPDRVEAALAELDGLPVLRPFERTAGDEIQAVFDRADDVARAVLRLVRDGHWSVGIGVGPVEEPLPPSTRAGRGDAFILARDAVRAAKRAPQHVAVRAVDPALAAEADALLALLAALTRGRTPQAWEAVDLVDAEVSQAEAAAKLGVTPQAVNQRLAAGHWREERAARPALARLLARADRGSARTVPQGAA